MSFCLDDGSELLYGPADAGGQTVMLPGAAATGESATVNLTDKEVGRSEDVPVPNSAKKRGYLVPIVIAIVVIGFVGAATVFVRSRNSGTTIDSIAVLPFTNVNGDPDTEYLSDGITESLINSFSQLQPKLRVIPRSTVFRYAGQTVDPQEVGQKLGVRAVLTGRVLQRGDTVSIQTELIDIDQASQIWGEQYNRKLSDLLHVQEEIGSEISEKLRLQLSGDEERRFTKKYTENPEAYQLYLKGVYHAMKFSKEELTIGYNYLNQAIAIDPNYALAYHGLAYYYYLVVDWTLDPREAMPKAKAAAEKALAIDDSLASAHSDLGAVHWQYDWDFAASEKELKRAIELDPHDSLIYENYGWLLVLTGRIDEGIAAAKKSQQIEPLNSERTSVLGWELYMVRRYDESIEQQKKALELEPEYWPSHSWLGQALTEKKQYPEAIAAFQKAISIENEIAEPLAGLGRAYALSGDKQNALKVVEELKDRSKHPWVSSYLLARLYVALGDKERAFASLQQAFDERSWYMPHMQLDPGLDPIRSDPRFAELAHKVGLP